MGFWGNLGKTLLEAAPYIAAPFTGGASLLATPLTSKLTDKWVQHDAADDIAHGIAPSGYGKYLSMAGDIGSVASSAVGGLGGISALSKLGNAGKLISAATPVVSSMLANKSNPSGMMSASASPSTSPGLGPSAATAGNLASQYAVNPMGQSAQNSSPSMSGGGGYMDYSQNMNNPNLQSALGMGNAAAQSALRKRGLQ